MDDILTNPMLVFEVLSETTKDYDRSGKFEQYRTLPSFREYLLIAQDRPHIELFTRQPDGRWLLGETNRIEDTVELASIDCALSLMEIYDKVPL